MRVRMRNVWYKCEWGKLAVNAQWPSEWTEVVWTVEEMQDGDTNTQTDGLRRGVKKSQRVGGKKEINYVGIKGKK